MVRYKKPAMCKMSVGTGDMSAEKLNATDKGENLANSLSLLFQATAPNDV
jgi:hypothetical protein